MGGVIIAFGVPVFILAFRKYVKEERWGFKDKHDRYSCVSMTANQLPPSP